MLTPTCPCCSDTLLRHARSGEVYWFCRCCYQEMPTLEHGANSAKSTICLGSGTAALPQSGYASPSLARILELTH